MKSTEYSLHVIYDITPLFLADQSEMFQGKVSTYGHISPWSMGHHIVLT